jgi:DnaJ-class molecular chaperone
MARKFTFTIGKGFTEEDDEDISCPECCGDGNDLDDEEQDCTVCGGTGTTNGEDWYP